MNNVDKYAFLAGWFESAIRGFANDQDFLGLKTEAERKAFLKQVILDGITAANREGRGPDITPFIW